MWSAKNLSLPVRPQVNIGVSWVLCLDVKVHLLTNEGVKKISADCLPKGYYIIPIYDKGSFILQFEGPQGWVFSPALVPIAYSLELSVVRILN